MLALVFSVILCNVGVIHVASILLTHCLSPCKEGSCVILTSEHMSLRDCYTSLVDAIQTVVFCLIDDKFHTFTSHN